MPTVKTPSKTAKSSAGQPTTQAKAVPTSIEITYIPVTKILPHPLNPRPWSELHQCHVNDNKVHEVASSIEISGYDRLEPIQVRKIGNSYQIISGHHRYCAVVVKGLKDAPCAVIELDDMSAALRLVSRQGESIKPWDMAYHAYRLCIQEAICSQVEYSQKTGLAASLVSKQVIACKVNTAAGLDRQLTTSACAAIARAPESKWEELAKQALQKNLSVREIEQIIAPAPKTEPAPPMPAEVIAPENTPTKVAEIDQSIRTTTLPAIKAKGLHQPIGHMSNVQMWNTQSKFHLALINNSTLREDLQSVCEKLDHLIHKGGRVIIVTEPRHTFKVMLEMTEEDWSLEQQLTWLSGNSGDTEATTNWPNCYHNILVFHQEDHPAAYFQGQAAAKHFKCPAQNLFRFGTSPGGGISAPIAHLLLQTYAATGSHILIPAAFEKDAIMAGQLLDMKVTWLEPIETIFEAISQEVS